MLQKCSVELSEENYNYMVADALSEYNAEIKVRQNNENIIFQHYRTILLSKMSLQACHAETELVYIFLCLLRQLFERLYNKECFFCFIYELEHSRNHSHRCLTKLKRQK